MSARKRFYKAVTIDPAEEWHKVLLDGRVLRSPAGSVVLLPTASLANAVASEWDAQQEEIEPASMPQFSLAVTVLDRVMTQREALVDEMASYGANDLLCYRDEDDVLAAHEHTHWAPWLEWAETELQAPLALASGIMPVTQPTASVAALRAAVDTHNDWELGMLHRSVALGGSLILGLGFVRGKMDDAELFTMAFLDELWQVEKWGSDFEAEDRRDNIKRELAAAARFLALLRDAA